MAKKKSTKKKQSKKTPSKNTPVKKTNVKTNPIIESESLRMSENNWLNSDVNATNADPFSNNVGPEDKASVYDELMKNIDFMPVETLKEIAASGVLDRKGTKRVKNAIRDAEKQIREDAERNKKEQKRYEKAIKTGKIEEDPFRKKFNSFEEVESYFIERDGEICAHILDTNPQFLKQLILSDDKDLVDFVCYINKNIFTKVDYNVLHLTYDENKIDNFRIIAKEILTDKKVLEVFKHTKYRDDLNLLEVAIADGKNDYIEALLSSGYPLNNFHEEEYIMQAINADNLDALKLLAENGANIDLRYEDGSTLLQRLATVNDMEKFRALLIRGADYETTNVPGQDLITYLHNNNRNDFRSVVLQYIRNGGNYEYNYEYNDNFSMNNEHDTDDTFINVSSVDHEIKKSEAKVSGGTKVGSTEDALRIQNANTKFELEKMKLQNEVEIEKMKLEHERLLQEQKIAQMKSDNTEPESSEKETPGYDKNRAMRVKKVSQYVSPHMIPDPERARRIREELKTTPRPTSLSHNSGKDSNFPQGSMSLANRKIPPMNQGYTGRIPNRASTRNHSGYNFQGYTDRLLNAGIGAGPPQDMNNNNGDFGYEERVKYDLLRHLKILFDEEVITYDEYVLEKNKILGHFEQ